MHRVFFYRLANFALMRYNKGKKQIQMRNIYLGFFAFIWILGLIIAFENIMIPANGAYIFFSPQTGSMFWVLLFILSMGLVSGLFLGLAIGAKKQGENEYEGDDML